MHFLLGDHLEIIIGGLEMDDFCQVEVSNISPNPEKMGRGVKIWTNVGGIFGGN